MLETHPTLPPHGWVSRGRGSLSQEPRVQSADLQRRPARAWGETRVRAPRPRSRGGSGRSRAAGKMNSSVRCLPCKPSDKGVVIETDPGLHVCPRRKAWLQSVTAVRKALLSKFCGDYVTGHLLGDLYAVVVSVFTLNKDRMLRINWYLCFSLRRIPRNRV